MSKQNIAEIQVGDGATEIVGFDRYDFTVIGKTAKTVIVQQDKATRTDSNGYSENQDYKFEADPNGKVYVLRLTKHRGWARKGIRFNVGVREEYLDPCF